MEILKKYILEEVQNFKDVWGGGVYHNDDGDLYDPDYSYDVEQRKVIGIFKSQENAELYRQELIKEQIDNYCEANLAKLNINGSYDPKYLDEYRYYCEEEYKENREKKLSKREIHEKALEWYNARVLRVANERFNGNEFEIREIVSDF